ncbi:MAG: hypothetical protein RL226_1684 [Bacteroidota bacterium]|jgi:hypothetical protein
MSDKLHLRRVVLALLVALPAVHFSMVLIYTMPSKWLPETLVEGANTYVNPIFHQGWQLFAPDVVQERFQAEVRYSSNGQWSEWESGTSHPELQWNTRWDNLTQKMLQVLGRDLKKNLIMKNGQPDFSLIMSYRPYNQWLYFSVRRIEALYGIRPELVQIRFVSIPSMGWSGTQLPVKAFEFPPFDLISNQHVAAN